jgi:hypothetical protein
MIKMKKNTSIFNIKNLFSENNTPGKLEQLLAPVKLKSHIIIFYLIIFLSFAIRFVHLNYNTAFNDEAIYIVIGRMGLFSSDWWSYGASQWMAGLPYIYPTLSALAYQTYGLLASRFLNVIFGVIIIEEVYRFTLLLNLFRTNQNIKASLIAALIAGISGVGIFVSRLATYDMPSFMLLMLGINSFLKAKYFDNGKYYFLTFIFLFTAFLTKIIIGIFFPFLFLTSLLVMRKRVRRHKNFAINYLYTPFVIASIIFFVSYFHYFMTFINTHVDEGLTTSYWDLFALIMQVTAVILIFSIPSAVYLIRRKKAYAVIFLITMAATIPLFHLALKRYATFDKHLYLTVIFLTPLAGYGMSKMLGIKRVAVRKRLATSAILALIVYSVISFQLFTTLEKKWRNTSNLQVYLTDTVENGNRVLTEEGASVILALYDEIFPPDSIVTFDWINYSGYSDEKGYLLAVHDKYFDYIELDNGDDETELEENIRITMVDKYKLSNKLGEFEIYEKTQ